jgi:hypothetical protein
MRAFLPWMRQWFRDAIAASTRPRSLPGLGERRLGAAFAHLATLTIVFWVLPFSVMFFVGARQGITALDEGLRDRVPAGTVFELKGGKLTDNLQAPLVVRNPAFTLIVNTASSTMDLAATETGVVVTQGGIFNQDGVRRESVSFDTAPPFRKSREDIRSDLARWAPLVLFLGSLIVLLAFFAFMLIGFLVSAAFHALALWLALKIWKRAWPWKRAFVTAAYAATGPFILMALLTIGETDFSLLSTALYWALMAWILFDAVRSAPAPGKDGHGERKEQTVDRPDGDGRTPA